MLKKTQAGVLNVAYFESGPSNGTPVLLLHGFPYDVHSYDQATPLLVSAGCRVLTPYLRGYGPTQFLSENTLRSGQQAVLAHDLLAFMDALRLENAILAGYDWGGRAACITAAIIDLFCRDRRLECTRPPGTTRRCTTRCPRHLPCQS